MQIRYCFLTLYFGCFSIALQGQMIEFDQARYTFQEPLDLKNKVDSSFTYQVPLKLKCTGCKDATVTYKVILPNRSAQGSISGVLNDSGRFSSNTSSVVMLELTTNRNVDKDLNETLIVCTLDSSGKLLNSVSTIVTIENTHPKTLDDRSNPAFGELRVADVFIGMNFDLLDQKFKANDLYGGLRLFLPNVTRIAQKPKDRLGLMAGLYQSNSFSRVSYPSLDASESNSRIAQRIVTSIPINGVSSSIVANDSVRVKSTSNIRNFGLYGGFLMLVNRQPKRLVEDGIFHFHVGVYTEVIRRSVTYSFQVDTLQSATRYDTIVNNRSGMPSREIASYPTLPTDQMYTDFYVGINFPIQYHWKDMLDMRIIPTFGVANVRYNASSTSLNLAKNPVEGTKQFFYMVQFDLLARLGGLAINLGGELRGYPNVPPIMCAYLGTSFKLSKLAEFFSQ